TIAHYDVGRGSDRQSGRQGIGFWHQELQPCDRLPPSQHERLIAVGRALPLAERPDERRLTAQSARCRSPWRRSAVRTGRQKAPKAHLALTLLRCPAVSLGGSAPHQHCSLAVAQAISLKEELNRLLVVDDRECARPVRAPQAPLETPGVEQASQRVPDVRER